MEHENAYSSLSHNIAVNKLTWEIKSCLKSKKGVWFSNSLKARLPQLCEMGQVMHMSMTAGDNLGPRSSVSHMFLYLYI